MVVFKLFSEKSKNFRIKVFNPPYWHLEVTLVRIYEFSQGRWRVLIGPWTDCNFVCTMCNLRRTPIWVILLVRIDRSGFTWCNYENIFTATTRTWSIVKWIIDLGLKKTLTKLPSLKSQEYFYPQYCYGGFTCSSKVWMLRSNTWNVLCWKSFQLQNSQHKTFQDLNFSK